MILSLEYLTRNRVIEELVEYPLSLFLEGQERVAITFDKKGTTKLLVRRFFLDRTSGSEALPPYDEFVIKRTAAFNDTRIVMPGFTPLEFNEEPVEADMNSERRPMESQYYEYFATNLFNSGFHRSVKENWLWSIYYETYIKPHELARPQLESMDEQIHKMHVKDAIKKDKYLWTSWTLWRRIIMTDQRRGIAGELVFTPVYSALDLVLDVNPSCSGLDLQHTS